MNSKQGQMKRWGGYYNTQTEEKTKNSISIQKELNGTLECVAGAVSPQVLQERQSVFSGLHKSKVSRLSLVTFRDVASILSAICSTLSLEERQLRSMQERMRGIKIYTQSS